MLFKETNRSGASWRSYGYEKSTAIDFSWWLGHFQTGRSFKEEKCFEFRGNGHGWSHEVSGFVCCHCIVYCTFPSKSIYLLDEVGREGGSHHWKFQTGFKGCCQGMPVPGASQLELFAAALVLLKVGKAESGKRWLGILPYAILQPFMCMLKVSGVGIRKARLCE